MTGRDPGSRRIAIPQLGFGGGSAYGANADRAADALLHDAYARGFRYFDTAPFYGHGLSEHRFGLALRHYPRDEFLLSTKVGRMLRPRRDATPAPDELPFDIVYDYTHDGVLRSIEDSLQRLGMSRIDIVFIHDVSPRWHGDDYEPRFREAMDGAHRALARLRAEGAIGAFGVGVKDADVCLRFARAGDFDCFMLAGGYTLLEHRALDAFLPYCEARHIDVVLASPFNSGVLAVGDAPGATYFYAPAPPSVRERTRLLQAICARYAVPLGAAALQFPLAHPAIVSAVAGYRSTAEIETNLAWSAMPIPAALWDELKAQRLLPPDAPVPERAPRVSAGAAAVGT
jgi:D-threo-aldose 1-dehydrogenase